MKVQARIDVLANNEWHKAGSVFDIEDNTGRLIVNMGWGEEVAEAAEAPAPKKATKKKAAAKK